MIGPLLIQNFQAHERMKVEFGPTITTIVGDSDRGKSTIIRALRWAAANQPPGLEIIRHGTKGACVTLHIDGRKIRRRRSKSRNEYELDGQELKAFGRGVPEEIEALVSMPRVCWQLQHDTAYWFGESAGEVSRQLNQIIDLGIIDTTLQAIGRRVTRTKTRAEVALDDYQAAKEAAEGLQWVDAYSEAVNGLLRARDAKEAAERPCAALALDLDTATKRQGAVIATERPHTLADAMRTKGSAWRKATGAEAELGALVSRINELADGLRHEPPDAVAMEAAADEFGAVVRSGRALAAVVASATEAAVALKLPEPDLAAMDAAATEFGSARKSADRLADVLQAAKDLQVEVADLQVRAAELEGQLPEQCPTCGQYKPKTGRAGKDHAHD